MWEKNGNYINKIKSWIWQIDNQNVFLGYFVLIFSCLWFGLLCIYAVATPKQIRELMKVDGLTNDEVKSHLQVDFESDT